MGPLAEHVKLSEGYRDKFDILEAALGRNLLESFMVFSNRDKDTLVRICQNAGLQRMPTIWLPNAKTRYQVRDTAHTGLVFLKDCLHIQNDFVFNLLVDVSKIDCVWFAPDEDIVNLFQQKPGVNILAMNYKLFLSNRALIPPPPLRRPCKVQLIFLQNLSTIWLPDAKTRYQVRDTTHTGLVFLKDCILKQNDFVFNLLVEVSKINYVWFAPDDEIVNQFQQKPGVNILAMNSKLFLGIFYQLFLAGALERGGG